jgi:hypothetical protein
MTSVAIPPKTTSAEEEHVETLDEILHEEEATAAGCGILGRYPLLSVISFAALGLAVGIVSTAVDLCGDFRPCLELKQWHRAFRLLVRLLIHILTFRLHPSFFHYIISGLKLLDTRR